MASLSQITVKDLMTSPVVTVEMDDDLTVVKDIFDHTHFHHLAVVEENELYGVLSDRDLFKALSPAIGTPAERHVDRFYLKRKAHQIMTRRPTVIGQHQSLRDAIRLFEKHRVSCLPVLSDAKGGDLVGMLSWRDLLKVLRQLLD
jgi:acetoin utilization protein AcuB